MPNCRSIPPEFWAQARKVLVFYFARRHESDYAQDLAQETLAALWTREDYEFESEADFIRVCLGFARQVSKAGHRRTGRDAEQVVIEHEVPSPGSHSAGARATEGAIYLEQVCNLGETHLRERDWELIMENANADGMGHLSPAEQNKLRVRLHRARRRLAEIVGWQR